MNRYSQYNVAQYDPLSMQEIIAAPLYKQKQFDALEEARVKQAEMFKIDPRSKYADEAQRIQNEYMTKVDELARYQTKTGDIQGSKSKFLDLQREYKKLNDPMGKVTQINSEKIATETEIANYIKGATAMKYSPDRVQAKVNEMLNKHDTSQPLFNDKGMINQFKATLPGKYEDYIEETKALMKETGMSSSEIKTLTDNFQHDIKTGVDYTKAVSKLRTSSNNKDQRGSVVDFIVNKVTNPNSDMRQTMDYEGIDLNTALRDISNLSGVYKKDTIQREDGVNIGNVQRPTSSDNDSNKPKLDGENVPLPEITVQNKNKNLLEKLTLGNSSSGSPKYLDLNTGRNGNSTNVWSKNSDIIQDPDYKAIAYGLNRKNGKNFKPGSIEERKAVVEYLTNNTGVGIQNARIDPNVSVSGNLFANKSIPKDKTKASENLRDKLKRNELLAVTENGEKIEAEDIESFTYTGDLTAESTITAFNAYDSRSNKLAHTGYITKKDGDEVVDVPVYVSRSINDFDKSEYKGGVDFYNIANTVKNRPGIYAQFKDDLISGNQGKNIKDFEVKYNSAKKTYDINYYDVNNKKTVSINNMDENKFQEALIISNNR